MRVLAFEAVMEVYSPLTPAPVGRVSRTIAVRDDQSFDQLHEALRLAFGWDDPHLYSFWVGPRFWDRGAVQFTAPFEVEVSGKAAENGRSHIAAAGLKKGSVLSYVFDFGDEWRLRLKVVDTWQDGGESYPMLVAAEGTPPPQYPPHDGDDE